MKKLSVLLAAAAVFCFTAPAFAAPVFPDVPEEHWARDAVANLAASGLVEGYPDGTFKGDRAATRYEMAMVIARFLAKNEQEHATFATKADLEELRKLVNQLKSELDALGVRVSNLEDSVASLDKRVTELERITFYGELDAIFTTQGFKSNSVAKSFNGFGYVDSANIPQSYAGSVPGANLEPRFGSTVFPTMDYRNGRTLTSGTGVSAVAKLGINAKVSDDVDAGLELAAYTAVGDPIVNSLYGVQQPYMSNVFAGQGNYSLTGITGNANGFLTAVTLDNFWVKHKPSGIKVTVGSFGEMNMDPILFAGQPNPNMNGTAYIPNYGFRVNGTANFLSDMDWEVFYTSLPDANKANDAFRSVDDTTYGYNTYAYGLDLGWRFKGGNFKLGYLRALNDGINYTGFGTDGGIREAGIQWAAPIEYLHRTDDFTVPASLDENGTSVFGEQATTNWSAHFDYTWEDSKLKPRFFAEYAHSTYKSNNASDYSVSGGAFRAGLGATFFNDSLDVDVTYKSVDPAYDPFILRYPTNFNAMWNLSSFGYFPGMYQLHDSEVYTNNRQGWDFKLTYRFKDERGKIWASYKTYQQVETSVAKTVGNIGGNYFGFYEPGFIDAVFTPVQGASYTVDLAGVPTGIINYDDNKGKQQKFDVGVNYKFQNNLGLELGYYNQTFKRDTNFGGYQLVNYNYLNTSDLAAANYVDLRQSGFHAGVSYPFNEKFTGKIGYDYNEIKGHYDPTGVYANYATASLCHDYENLATKQSVVSVGFDYKLSQNTEWGLNLQYFTTKNNSGLYTAGATEGTTVIDEYNWNGTQLTTEFKVKF